VPWPETPRVWRALLEGGAADGRGAPLASAPAIPCAWRCATRSTATTIDSDDQSAGGWSGLGREARKGAFVGRDAIERVRADGPRRRLVGLEMADRAIARHGYSVVRDGRAIGVVTSGRMVHRSTVSIALAYVETAHAAIDTELGVEIRGQARPARVVRTPFHPPHVKR